MTLTALRVTCDECRHPGPSEPVTSVTLWERTGESSFVIVPHRAGCSTPRLPGHSATIHFHDTGERSHAG